MRNAPFDDALQLSRTEMQALGYQVIDLLVEHFESLRDKPVTRSAARSVLEERLREPLPERDTPASAVLLRLQQDVFGQIMHLDHPRFFAFVPSPSNFVSVMADTLAAGFNVFAGTWLEASGPAEIELVTIDWLRQLCGLPDTTGGLFVSGGSVANLTALAVARHVKLQDGTREAVLYASDQVHSSVERGCRLLGFDPSQLRKLPSDECFRLALPVLRQAILDDRAAGRHPFCVVANVGSTNTGAVDPLSSLADFCREEGLWLHADGAYGAAAVLCDRGRSLMEGLERVDSLSLDPHKWWFQPYEIGCVLVRSHRQLLATFHTRPEYLKDLDRVGEEINFCDYGIQLTRSFRALKLWMSLTTFGLGAFRQAVARGIALAEWAEEVLRRSAYWEIVTPAQIGIVTFRPASVERSSAEVDAISRRLVDEMIADGFAMVSSTVLRGCTVLRLCTINPRTTEADIEETIQRLEHLGMKLSTRLE
jgi:aromatic-L-amino-acid/L-tryptophan decarboxylase